MFVVSKDQNSAVLLIAGRPPRYFVAEPSCNYCEGCPLFSPDKWTERGTHCDVVFDAHARNPLCVSFFRADNTEIIWKEVAR